MKSFNYIKENRFALLISLFYVTLGGVVACSMYPNNPLNGEWWFWGWLITFPVNIISVTCRATASLNYFPVIIIQLVVFIPTFMVVSRIVSKKGII